MSTDESIHDSDDAAPQRYDPKGMYAVIKSVLKAREISDLQCEVESGVTRGTLWNLKIGSMPSIDKIAMIADYLGISVDFILGRTSFTFGHDSPIDSELSLSEEERDMLAVFANVILIPHRRNK